MTFGHHYDFDIQENLLNDLWNSGIKEKILKENFLKEFLLKENLLNMSHASNHWNSTEWDFRGACN